MPLPVIAGAAIAAGSSLLGGWLTGNSQERAQESANETNIQLQREQNRYEAGMASSAYQRAAMDMRAAGLNPAVMFNQGAGGAATPSQSAATVESTQKDAARSRFEGLVQASALAESQARAAQSRAQAGLMNRQTKRIASEEMLMSAQAQSAKEQSWTLEAARPKVAAESKFEADYLTNNSAWERMRRTVVGPGGGLLDVAKPFVRRAPFVLRGK